MLNGVVCMESLYVEWFGTVCLESLYVEWCGMFGKLIC